MPGPRRKRRWTSRSKRDALADMKADGETVMPLKRIPTFTDPLKPNELVAEATHGTCGSCDKSCLVSFRAWFRKVRPRCNHCGGLLTPSDRAQREYPQLRTRFGVDDERKPGKPRRTPLTCCYYCGVKTNLGRWQCYTCKCAFTKKFRHYLQQYAIRKADREVEFPEPSGPFRRSGYSGLASLVLDMEQYPIQEVIDDDDQIVGYACGKRKPAVNLVIHIERHGVIKRGHCGCVLTDLGVRLLVVYRSLNPNRHGYR